MRDETKIILKTVLITVNAILILIGGYALLDNQIEEIKQETATQTFEIINAEIINKAFNCEPIPVVYQNQTANLIAIECLQQQQ